MLHVEKYISSILCAGWGMKDYVHSSDCLETEADGGRIL